MANISQITFGINSYSTDVHVSNEDHSIDRDRDNQQAMGYIPKANEQFSSTLEEPDLEPNFSVWLTTK